MTDYTGPVFPVNHAPNTPVDNLPVHPDSGNFVAGIGADASLHPDFGTAWDDGGTLRQMGIPYNMVGAGQAFVPIAFVSYPDESDPGSAAVPPASGTDIPDIKNSSALDLVLHQNYPNPFTSATTISFTIKSHAYVLLSVYDITGREIITLVNAMKTTGTHRVQWNGKDANGHLLSRGFYFYQLRNYKGIVFQKKMICI